MIPKPTRLFEIFLIKKCHGIQFIIGIMAPPPQMIKLRHYYSNACYMSFSFLYVIRYRSQETQDQSQMLVLPTSLNWNIQWSNFALLSIFTLTHSGLCIADLEYHVTKASSCLQRMKSQKMRSLKLENSRQYRKSSHKVVSVLHCTEW
jgi:hypothetical protein